MDNILEISNMLENSNITENKKKELLDNLKINLIDVQDEIDLKETNFKFNLDKKIENYKKLLSQISDEITLNENLYNREKQDYMFPQYINELNKKLEMKLNEIDRKSISKKKLQKELSEIVNKKIELNNEYSNNRSIINSKKHKIQNNMEITALLEKKNRLIGNKKKNVNEMNYNIEIEEKNTRNLIQNEKKNTEARKKKINTEITNTNKLLSKTILSLRNINSDTKEYKIRNKEIDTLNNRVNLLQTELDEESIKFIKKEKEYNKNLKNLKKKEQEKNEISNDKIDEIIILIDEKFKELNNLFVNLKTKNLGIIKELKVLEEENQRLEVEIFKINLDKIVSEKNHIDSEIRFNQEKSCHKYMTYRNKFEDKMDKLIKKKNRLSSKIEALIEKKKTTNCAELINTKNFISKILNGYS